MTDFEAGIEAAWQACGHDRQTLIECVDAFLAEVGEVYVPDPDAQEFYFEGLVPLRKEGE